MQTCIAKRQELQMTMCLIAELLGMLRRCRRDLQQSSRIEKEISTAVTKLEFLIGEYEYIASASDAQNLDEYQLGFRPLCPECKEAGMKAGTVRQAGQVTEAVIPPIWQSSLRFALSCTRVVADDYFGDRGTCTFENFPTCLVQLRTVLRRLQQLLPAPAIAETKLGVAKPPSCCANCGKSVEVVH